MGIRQTKKIGKMVKITITVLMMTNAVIKYILSV